MGFVGLVPSERSSGESPARIDHKGRLITRTAAAGRVRVARAAAPDGRLRTGTSPPRPRPAGSRARVALPATPPPSLAEDGRSRQAEPEDRRCMRARARWVRVGNRYRPTHENQVNDSPTSMGWRAVPPRRRTLATSMRRQPAWRPATLDRGSSRRTPVMRHQPANVSLTHRRCPGTPATPRPQHTAPTRAGP